MCVLPLHEVAERGEDFVEDSPSCRSAQIDPGLESRVAESEGALDAMKQLLLTQRTCVSECCTRRRKARKETIDRSLIQSRHEECARTLNQQSVPPSPACNEVKQKDRTLTAFEDHKVASGANIYKCCTQVDNLSPRVDNHDKRGFDALE
ncbi:expressed unknown protein [Seminavis robusta]|uniref:Uncharacterized protein n=1 Tax=Seminavis robusta TaxID=568900 RepID=A0A9N8EYK7_9STRA|nr:expressed unknown protein [Seminavis robusta]|eukprot:Sro2570_g331540.1 n/a (150) ;mRNA; r:4973-5422